MKTAPFLPSVLKAHATRLTRRTVLTAGLYFVNLLNNIANSFGRPIGLPQWLTHALPGSAAWPGLLGGKAFSYLLILAWMPGDNRSALRRIADFLCNSGLPDEGIAAYEALLLTYGKPEATPEALIVSYLQMLMFGSPEIQTHARILQQHVYWSQRFKAEKPYTHYANPLTTDRRLKIGYTCHFITNSTSTTQLQPLLNAHHRDRVEVFMYSDEPVATMNDSVRALAEHWRDTAGMGTDEFCELVRRDGIDVFNELNGHGIFNRYPVIGRHPAPVQVSWYNYACTTGVPGMDYVLTADDIEIKPLQPYYSETIMQKRGASMAGMVGSHFPELTEAPFMRNGYVTFCSFGQAHKVSRTQVLLWCEVMKRVPGSCFFMKAQALGHPASRAAFVHHFKSGGIDESRLILEGNSDYATLLGCYARVDIALDTFPANAGTTTIESTIMGVPVISLRGERYSSQTGRSILETAGHGELLATTPGEFVEKAVALAKSQERLTGYRSSLRKDFLKSPRCDIDRFISELEECYAEMWKRFVQRQKTSAA